MKVSFFICILIIGIPLQTFAQNIPNGNFEVWTSNSNGMPQPLHWETQNEPELIYVEPLTGYSGNFAACLNVQWDYMLKKYCGASLKSEFEIPISERKKFQIIKGYCKGKSENIDSLIIEVILFSENKMIGKGRINILENSNNWENFIIPIEYYSEVLPKRVSITISINPKKGSHSMSSYCIDDLLLANIETWLHKITINSQNMFKNSNEM